jgi:hypothetical protein|tara:strand:- start:1583 stop:1750 length:168 start_codon:yes stop_codon:yes gene_type:complete
MFGSVGCGCRFALHGREDSAGHTTAAGRSILSRLYEKRLAKTSIKDSLGLATAEV